MSDIPIKKVNMELVSCFREKVVFHFDFENATASDYSICYMDGDDDIDENDYDLDEYELDTLIKSFARCSKWQAQYYQDAVDGYSWTVEVDGKKYHGSNAVPNDWEELIDDINSCLELNIIFDIFSFNTDFSNNEFPFIEELCEQMEDEHPQTYYRGESLHKKGKVVRLEQINRVKTIATVIGSKGDEYMVTINQWSNSEKNSYECTCASSQPICKHIVAAVMAYRNDFIIRQYHEAVNNGTLIAHFDISEADLLKLAPLVDKCIIYLKQRDFDGISVSQRLIDGVRASLDERCQPVMQGLDWDGMVRVPWFPRIKMQELRWGLSAILAQVKYPTVETEAQRNYEKVLRGELIKHN